MATSTIKPAGGGDYSTLAGWAAGVSGNFGDEQAQCFAGDLQSLTVLAWSPASSTIYTDISAKHNGKDQGTAGLAFAGTIDIRVGASWVVQDMLCTVKLRHSATFGGQTPNAVFQRNLIVTASGSATPFEMSVVQAIAQSDSATYVARNNVVIIKTGATPVIGMYFLADASAGSFAGAGLQIETYNNTVETNVAVANGMLFKTIGGGVGTSATIDAFIVNDAVFGFTTCFAKTNTGTGATSPTIDQSDTNASSDATADDFGGSGNLINQSAAAWFTGPPSDLTLLTTSPGKNTGTDQSGTGFSDDIIGTHRPQSTAWDIGAFEFIPAGGGGSGHIFIGWPGLI